MMTHVFYILIAFLLVLLNAFFVAAEFGMVKLRYTRVKTMKETHGLRGKILALVHKHLDAYLSACQLGITLASIGLGWVGEPAFAHILEPLFTSLGITSPELITVIAFFAAFSIISFLHIVIGELMPKSLAIRQSEKISLWTAVPLYGFYWLMYPAIWFLNYCSNFLLRIFKLDAQHHGENFYLTEEIKLILQSSHLHGELTKDETEIIEHTLDFASLRVTEVMRPRKDMIMLDRSLPTDQLLQIVLKHRFSRYPVYDKEKDEIIGIIHVKDLFAALYENKQIPSSIEALIRPVLKVSHRFPALELLRKFRTGMPHFALVYIGRERLIGFVTLDNLLHVLIGRIKDEFHKTYDDWHANQDGSFTVKGDCSIYSLEQALDRDIEIDEAAEVDTVTGLIMHQLNSLPQQNDKIEFPEFTAIIEKIEAGRIQRMKVIPKPPTEEEED